ncbi:MAG TPA: aldo/keto reductase, partial [Gemmatimonadaceae bacterium]|nr:aldo/keto reductase [Gemmatimonadaceae bacterium]
DAHSAGMKVVVKESLANGRLTQGNRNENDVFARSIGRIREIAQARGSTIEMQALAAALSRPWADVVLSGAATAQQIQSTVAALGTAYDPEIEEQLRSISVSSVEYWRARSGFGWN